MNIDLVHINIVSVSLRLLLAALIGALIGYEREQRNQAAGLRTHMLICIGAALAMLTNQYICERLLYSNADPARIGAQVISGIGFLGVGTILITGRRKVRGLTTAAGLWASACAGLAVGIGFFEGAIIGSILIFLIIALLYKIDDKLKLRSRNLTLYIEISDVSVLDSVKMFFENQNAKITDLYMERIKSSDGCYIGLTVSLRLQGNSDHINFIYDIMRLPDVNFIQKI